MTPLEIALTCLGGYFSAGLAYARLHYRSVNWDLDEPIMNGVASIGAGLIWPLVLLTWGVLVYVTAPTRKERQLERQKKTQENIRRLERELEIGQYRPATPVRPEDELPDTFRELLMLWLRRRFL